MSDRFREVNMGPGGEAEPDFNLGAALAEFRTPPPPSPQPGRPTQPRGRASSPPVYRIDRERVQAAVAFHLGSKLPGIEWTRATKPLADRFIEMSAGNPQLIAALEEDVDTLFALSDGEIADRIVRGEPVSQLGDVWDAVAEVSWEVGASDLAARLEGERSDALQGTFDALTRAEALILTMPDVGDVAPGQVVLPDQAKGQTFQTLFDVPGAWSYSPSSGILAVTVGEQTIGVDARPGFDPDTHLDVMAEIVAAQADGRIRGGELTGDQREGFISRVIGVAHDVGAWLESHPFAKRSVDGLWRDWESIAAPKDSSFGGSPLERADAAIRDEKGQITENAIRMASFVPFPEDAVIAGIARNWISQHEGLTSQDALSLAAEAVAENRDQFVSEFENLTQEEFITQLEAELEDESALGRAVETGLGNVLETFDAWDQFTQRIGVNTVHFLSTVLGFGVTQDIVGDSDLDGFEKLGAIFEAATTAPEESNVADYWGLEGAWADTAWLAAGIGFDPLNLVFPGAKGVRALARKALTDPRFARLYLKSGGYPNVIRSIAGGDSMVVGFADEASDLVRITPEARSTRNVISLSGMSDDAYADLTRLARDPNATYKQVEDVFVRELSNDYLGEGPGRVIRHHTIQGVGLALESLAAGKLTPEAMDTMMKMVSKLSVSKSVRLGENQALDNFGDLLVQFFPNDPVMLEKWWLTALERRAGDGLALAGAGQLTKESARRAVTESGGTLKSIVGANDPAGINQNLRAVEDALTKVDSLGLAADEAVRVRAQLDRMHSDMSARMDRAAPMVKATKAKKQAAHKQLTQATHLEQDLANNSRNVMAGVVYDLYEDVATRINTARRRDVIPVIEGRTNPLAPGVPVRDWSEVTGSARRVFTGDDPELAMAMGLALDDAETAVQLDAIGMFNRSQRVVLPASPYEVILYEKIGHDKNLLGATINLMRGERMKTWGRRMKMLFAFNLLINPITAGKITLDETLRFFADTGDLRGFIRSTIAGLPGVGHVSEATIRRYGDAIVNPYGLQYSRNVGGWTADDFANYGWVNRPPRHVAKGEMGMARYTDQVERWVNGTLLNDRRFREYAHWVGQAEVLEDGTKIPPAGWTEWWDQGTGVSRPGRADVRDMNLRIRDQVTAAGDLTATEAFNIIDNAFGQWLNLAVDPKRQAAMRRALLDAATSPGGGLDRAKDAILLKAVQRVPGMEGGESQIFNMFFGGPSSRRAGVFYEHYFDEAYDILATRHGDRVLTVDKLMEYANVDRQTAQHWLKQGADNKVVSQLIRDTGARTEAQLAARAAVYAERRADDLMYRFTSASLVGRGIEAGLLFPFARAQVDFLSWWTNHLFKPMTVRLSPEMRARLPGVIQSAVAGVERIPLNLRAWAKYAHLVSMVNNDHPSVLDQIIDNTTFFPVRYDSNFLLDITPQFGPIPSWLFDMAVDKGLIGEEAEKNFEALFPALGFTEYEGDFAGDLIDRIVPISRRSIRDFAAGSLARAGSVFGSDVYTDTGKVGQLANFLNDGKNPAATGDFQTALIADHFAGDFWNVVPGSDEWDTLMRELAVKGALEANNAEWTQDLKDRVFPLAGRDREYRALRAYEGFFDDAIFQTLTKAGLFQANDLAEADDGKPRIVSAWDKYQEGQASPEELAWLDERLTTAYFAAGRLDVLPGFSYLDYLNLANPEVAVNLINKTEDSGVPVRSDDHAEFKRLYVNELTDRLQNVPPGDEGREIITKARGRGWLVSRPPEEWATDAALAVYSSAQRAVRGVWEFVSHRTWQQGLKQSIEDKTFTLGQREVKILEKAGLTVDATSYSYKEFHDLLDAFDERFKVSQPTLIDTMSRGAVHGTLARHPEGRSLLDALNDADKEWNDQGLSVSDWPEATKQKVRNAFSDMIMLSQTDGWIPRLTEADYSQELEGLFGPLDYAPPVPPPVEDLKGGIRLTGDELADLQAVDGDTVSVLMEDGPMRVRIIGINAPETTQSGFSEARDNLARVLEGAGEVILGVHRPELFGVTQISGPGERRLLAWLYVDGVPVYSPDVFTSDNPRGAGTGGTVLDLQAILEAGR